MNTTARNPGDPFADWDATYVLGALSPEDRTAYEAHLAGCDQCRSSVAGMAGVPGLLARVSVEQLFTDDSERVPSAVLPRLLSEVARDRRRERRRLATARLIAAACVVALLIAMTSLARRDSAAQAGPGRTSPAPSSSAGPVLTLAPRGKANVIATAQIQSLAWGTRIQLRCMHRGVSPPEPTATVGPGSAVPNQPGSYSLVIVARDRSQTTIATWHEVPGKTVQVEGDTLVWRADIDRLLVKDASDAVVLQVAV